jgi:hypothetical protein
MERWARKYFFANPQIANSEILRLIPQSQIRKFVMINPQIANPQSSLVSQSANRNPANLRVKKQCF